ncbi:hypothetical protein HMPREF0496_0991 [Lentilactobacillus hilgardii ATCC 27305]|nr:hypothetical protein HMPREF0496_0991 [Lentilactobacillus hilgardii ATCC 27305]
MKYCKIIKWLVSRPRKLIFNGSRKQLACNRFYIYYSNRFQQKT